MIKDIRFFIIIRNGRPVLDSGQNMPQKLSKHEGQSAIMDIKICDTEAKKISAAQMNWLHCDNGPFAVLSEKSGMSRLEAELVLKVVCGSHWFVKEVSGLRYIDSKINMTVNRTTEWIENIFYWMEREGYPVPPPDPNWRINKKTNRTKLSDS